MQTNLPGGSAATHRRAEVLPGWRLMMEVERVPGAGGWIYLWHVEPDAATFFVRDRRGDNRKLVLPPCSGLVRMPGLNAQMEVERCYPRSRTLPGFAVVRFNGTGPTAPLPAIGKGTCYFCDRSRLADHLTCGDDRCPEEVAARIEQMLSPVWASSQQIGWNPRRRKIA